MFRLLKPNLIRRFSHTHSKTIFPENNNKVIEDLIRQQNNILKEIDNSIYSISVALGFLITVIAFKPSK